jgi:hypothetical protein
MAATGIAAAAQPATAPNIVYTASGTFASPPISGADGFHLSGQPFTLTLVANAAAVPAKHGAQWADFGGLTVSVTLFSTWLPTPIFVTSGAANIVLNTGNPNHDVFELGFAKNIIGLPISVAATASLPPGTMVKALIRPFTTPVLLTPDTATVTYSDPAQPGWSTTLGITGILNAARAAAPK